MFSWLFVQLAKLLNSLIRWNMWRFLQHVLCSKAQSCGSKFEGKAGGRELSDAMIAREFMNAKEIPVTLNTSTPPPPNITVAMQKIDSQWKIPLNLNRTFFSYIAWEEQHVLFVSGSNFIFIGCQEAAVTPLIDSSVEKANLSDHRAGASSPTSSSTCAVSRAEPVRSVMGEVLCPAPGI